MRNADRNRRLGLSLTEVLVAIFVMGLGMLSLLVLFPVGLSNMKWALQDNRLALAAQVAVANGEAVQTDPTSGRPFTLRTDPNYYAALNLLPDSLISNGLLWWHPAGYPLNPLQPAYDPAGPRPPVYVDSVGVLAAANAASVTDLGLPLSLPGLPRWGYGIGARKSPINVLDQDRVALPTLGMLARGASYGIPRIRSAQITGLTDAVRACVQEDELTFGANAQPPGAGSGSAIEREARYSWAYMCRFPKADDDSVVDMTIVLYSGRKLTAIPAPPMSNDHTTGEQRWFGTATPSNAYAKVFVKGSNEALIQLYDPQGWTTATAPAGVAPPLPAPVSPFKKGDIVLDNTLVMPDFFTYIGAGLAPARYYAPFDTVFDPVNNVAPVPIKVGYAAPGAVTVRKGVAGGYFYKLLHVGAPEVVGGVYCQRLTLDRPALADGFEAVYLQGAVDIIEKSNGRMPTK